MIQSVGDTSLRSAINFSAGFAVRRFGLRVRAVSSPSHYATKRSPALSGQAATGVLVMGLHAQGRLSIPCTGLEGPQQQRGEKGIYGAT